MARKKESDFDLMINAAAKLPWWAGVLIAVILYLVLHSIAQAPREALTDINQLGSKMGFEIFRSISTIMQYFLPIPFLIGAAVSAFKSRQRKKLLGDTAAGSQAVSSLGWQEFEELVGEAFHQQGFRVVETPEGPDGGVDLVLRKGE